MGHPSHTRKSRRLAGAAVLAATALATAGCSAKEALSMNMPEAATEQGPIIEHLWFGSWVAAWAVGIVTWALIIYAAVAFRRKDGDGLPSQLRYNVPLEVAYTIAPLFMILGLFFFTVRDEAKLTQLTNDYTNKVDVVGFRWSWAFNYKEGAYDTGVASTNVEELPTLWLPVNEKTRFTLQSPDVIHSFWVTNFLFKMDVIPGRMNQFEVTPNRVGTFSGKCTELCGVDHARMLFNVKVVERGEYDAHIAELKANGNTGAITTDRITREGERYWEKDKA